MLLVDLDPDQRHAVTTPSRSVAVLAGAGSGKTRVLTRRVAWRIATGDADATHTLVLTFTREAASELRRRITSLGIGTPVDAGTFHSTALALLHRRWEDTNRRAPTVLDDRRRLVTEVLSERRDGSSARTEEILAELSWALARGFGPDDVVAGARTAGRRSPVIASLPAIIDEYATLKRRRGVIDLDDVLTIAVRELEQDADLAAATRWRHRHLLIDEAQDLNPLQHRFLDVLRRDSDDLFLVGDPAQAIYGFNGADPTLLDDIDRRLPTLEVIHLPVNHRCTPQIVAAGAHVLAHGGATVAARADDLRSAREDGPRVAVSTFVDADAEAAAVASEVAASDPDLIRASRLAVLARTNRQCIVIVAALEQVGVPVMQRRLRPGELRDALDHVQRLTAHGLRTWAHDTVEAAGDGSVHRDRLRVADAVFAFCRDHPDGDGTALRAWVHTTDPFDVRADAGVEVLTFHAAKGREWFRVWVTGAESGLMPHRGATTVAARHEEARLAYVALTRATDECRISWAERRGGYRRERSRFLDDFVSTGPIAAPPPQNIIDDDRRADAGRRTEMLEALHLWRDHAAHRAGILPDAICSVRHLGLLAENRPASADAFGSLTGIGPLTAARLYPSLAEVLNNL